MYGSKAPEKCTPEVASAIIRQHCEAPSVWAIFPLQVRGGGWGGGRVGVGGVLGRGGRVGRCSVSGCFFLDSVERDGWVKGGNGWWVWDTST